MKSYSVTLVSAKRGEVRKTVSAYSISHAIAEAVRGEGNVVSVSARLDS